MIDRDGVLERDLPDYTFESVLGKGASSTVYLGQQKRLGRYVAIKRIEASKHLIVDSRSRFEREAAMWSQFSHENLIHLYDYRIINGTQYIMLEYRYGIEVRNLLIHCVRLPATVVGSIAIQILQALEYIHRYGIVHRDIKPSNLFITSEGVVKLMDFSISLCPELDPLTLPGEILGTPAYMSPEQGLGKKTKPSSDFFSLGVTMYEMLEGCLPFKADNLNDLLEEIRKGKYERLSRRVPTPLKNFVKKALQNNPKNRFEDATDAKAHLQRYLDSARIYDPRACVREFLIKNKLVETNNKLFHRPILDKNSEEPADSTAMALFSLEAEMNKTAPRQPSRFRVYALAALAIVFLVWIYATSWSAKPDWKAFGKGVVGMARWVWHLFS